MQQLDKPSRDKNIFNNFCSFGWYFALGSTYFCGSGSGKPKCCGSNEFQQ